MKNYNSIAILCVILAIIGTASADVYEFTDSYDTMSMQGMLTFDENGILNGAVVAGTNNGVMDVNQHADTGNGEVLVYQTGNIEGNSGFATTAARDGSGNSGGTFASFTGGGMCFGQVSATGEIPEEFIPDPPLESTGDQLSQVGTVSSSINGVIAGQFVGIEGNSGYASTGARNVNGASGQSTASFIEGGMIVGQVSGAGEIISFKSYGTQISFPVGIHSTASFSSQSGGIQADSGSASTSGRTVHGALAGSDVSFTEGSMRFRQWVRGDSTTFSGVLGLGDVSSWTKDIQSYQSVDSQSFSTIGASSYSEMPDGSNVQVNAAAAGSYLPGGISGQLTSPRPEGVYFSTSQGTVAYTGGLGTSAGSGSSQDHEAWEDVTISGVESGSASSSAHDSTGNTASTLMYVGQGSLSAEHVYAETYRYEPHTLLGNGMLGRADLPVSKVETGYDDVDLIGNSGGLLFDVQNPRDYAYSHWGFSEGGALTSDIGYAFAGHENDAHSIRMGLNQTISGDPRVQISGDERDKVLTTGDYYVTFQGELNKLHYKSIYERYLGPGSSVLFSLHQAWDPTP